MFKIRFDNFIVHYEDGKINNLQINFEVYPVVDWTGPENTKGTSYLDKDVPSEMLNEFDPKKAKMLFGGFVCWRGCFDNRVYFVDDEEYYDDELIEMADLYKNHLKPFFEKAITNTIRERL